MRAATYTRVSLEEMAETGISLDMQTAETARYAERKGMKVVASITDAGRSGKDLNRQGIQQLVNLVLSHKIDAVICYRQDRLTRNVSDAMNLSEMFLKNGITLHTVCDSRVEIESADGGFRFGLQALLDQRERKLIAERTKAAMKRLREKGQRISGQSPYGYVFRNNLVVADEQEQTTIRRIQMLSEEGYSIRKISVKLASEGLFNREGKAFAPSAIHKIIKAA